MFLFEKYCPSRVSDFMFNREIMEQLIHISINENIPHIIISGPSGAGKKTLVKFFLEAIYDSDINNLSKIKYNISGSSAKKEIEISQSNYHIIIEPTNTNHDKYILQEIIKQYAIHKSFNIFKSKRKFKTIVIYNLENLANNSQAALRRTMELYAKSCRFIMVCNNLSKIFDPLKSRCRTFCVPLPKISEISDIITKISISENIILNDSEMRHIIKNCNNNLKKAIWLLESKRLKYDAVITLDEIFNNVIKNILETQHSKDVLRIFNENIRDDIYRILITNIKGSEIIATLMDQLIKKIDDDEINIKIIQHASEAEYNLILGRREITHIDVFIMGVIRELRKHNNNNITKNKKTKKIVEI